MSTLGDFSRDVDRKLESILIETRTRIGEVMRGISKESDSMRITGEEGDKSENAGYQVAKSNLARLNNEARVLTVKETTLKKFTESGTGNSNRRNSIHVSVGSVIILEKRNVDTNSNYTFKVVPATLGDSSKGILGIDSPVGKKVLGKKVGVSVIAFTSTGEIEYLIKEIY